MSSLPVPQAGRALIPEAQAFRDSLRVEEQAAFDELYLAAYENFRLMEGVGLVIPLEKMLLAMLIEQQKQIQELQALLDRPPTHGSVG